MSGISRKPFVHTRRPAAPGRPRPPQWIEPLFTTPADIRELPLLGGQLAAQVSHHQSAGLGLLSISIPEAADLGPYDLRASVAAAYQLAQTILQRTATPHPIRIWNFVPDIHEALADGLDRYRTFNLGRFDAFCDWFGDPTGFARVLPTATCVGHWGSEIAIHILSSATRGTPVENPRQRPAFQYSPRYGPRPPCFARATIATVDSRRTLLIGGTASVRGEDSVHDGSLSAQLDELFENMRALIAAAEPSLPSPLSLIESARMYLPDAASGAALNTALRTYLPQHAHIELTPADICRPELLVEIEAVAALPQS